MKLSNEEANLFSLIKNERLVHPVSWDRLFKLAAKQGVLAIAYDGLETYHYAHLPKRIKIQWRLSVEQIESGYHRQKEAIRWISSLLTKHNIDLIILKGHSLALYYPNPKHRECGDIDIFLCGKYDEGNKLFTEQKIKIDYSGDKHSKFVVNGVPVENHKTLLNVSLNECDRNLEQYLLKILKDEGFVVSNHGDYHYNMPSFNFTALFLARHTIVHFLSSGLVLRHLLDLIFFFRNNLDNVDIEKIKLILLEERQLKLFVSLIATGEELLSADLKISTLFCEPDMRLTNKVYRDIMRNSIRVYDKNSLINRFVTLRKMSGAIYLIRSKWKYDAVGSDLFYKEFINRIKLAFT